MSAREQKAREGYEAVIEEWGPVGALKELGQHIFDYPTAKPERISQLTPQQDHLFKIASSHLFALAELLEYLARYASTDPLNLF